MMRLVHRAARPQRDDQGFTLIEVIVALVLLGIVASAALGFFIEGTQTSSHLQRSQNAVAVANEAMEVAYGVNPRNNPATGVPGPVVGRAKADVQAAFAAASGVEGVAATYPLWDPGAASSTGAALKLKYPTTLSGEEYEVTTLVGSCYRLKSTTVTNQTCGKLSGHAQDPTETAAAAKPYVRMLRIIVVVRWEPAGGECSGGTCTYQLSGLVDRSNDLEWNQVVQPVAVADSEMFVVNDSPRDLDLLANDLIGPLASSPVEIVTPPAAGSLTPPNAGGVTRYTVPPNASGIFPFTYRIRDARGAISDPATVTLSIAPEISPDHGLRAVAGQPNALDVLANDRGSKALIEVTRNGARGNAVATGLTVTYTPNPGVINGTDSFEYRYQDPSGQWTDSATVTLNIDNIVAVPRTTDIVLVPGMPQWTDLTPLLTQGNTDLGTLRIVLTGNRPAHGTLQLGTTTFNGGTSAPGTSVRFDPPDRVGEYSFQYQLARVNGATSPAQQVTVRVLPTGQPDSLGNIKDGSSPTFAPNSTLGGNDMPVVGNASNTQLELSQPGSGCGSFTTLSNGQVRYNAPSFGWWDPRTRACSAQYTIVGQGADSALRSAPVSVTWTVVD